MSSLVTTYSLPPAAASSYWLKLKPEEVEDDYATIGEMANLLDAVYDRNPCDLDESEEQQEPLEEEEPMTKEELWQKAQEMMDFSACDDEPGCSTAYLRVLRSHQQYPYKLVLENGEQLELTVQSETVQQRLVVRGANYIDLDYPVTGTVTARWISARGANGQRLSNPSVEVDGSRLVFKRNLTGLLEVKYQTTYDRVAVSIPKETDGQPGACRVLAYYQGTVSECELEPAPVDDSIDEDGRQKVCGGGGSTEVPEKPHECYILVRNQILCRCSGKESGLSFYTEESCACPDHWNDDISPGRHLVGSRTVTTYTHCAGEGIITKADLETYEQVCCEGGVPPECETVYAVYKGNKAPELEPLRERYGDNVQLVPLGPPDAICGKWTTTFKRPTRNCCDEVEPLTADPDNPTEITPNGARELSVLGGNQANVDEWVWTCSGTLFFANGLNQIVGGREQMVYAPKELCADNVVRVEDGCSAVNMALAADVEPLSITYPGIGDVLGGPLGKIYVLVEGGLPEYDLVTHGQHTYWEATGTKEVTVASAGWVALIVEKEQLCVGNFTVVAGDRCADIAQEVIDMGEVPVGVACMRYVHNCGSCTGEEDPTPQWIEFDGMSFASTIYTTCSGCGNQAGPSGYYIDNRYYHYTLQEDGYWKIDVWELLNKVGVPAWCEECK